MQNKAKNQIKGIHHFYIGLIIWVIGFFLIFKDVPSWIVITCCLVGAGLMVDDTFQHMLQRINPEYRSPIHKLYGFLIYSKSKLIRNLNIWFDGLLGK